MDFFHEKNHDLLVYRPPSTYHIDGILQHVTGAKQINGSYVAVPRTLRNSQVLRWLNYPVPQIVTDENYDWPIEPGRKPWESQRVTTNFMVLHPRSFVLSDMGVGKTIATLWAADWLMRQHAPGTFRALVVAPLSILERVWANAIFTNFLSSRRFEILHGDADKRSAALAREADFYIVNFDGVGVGAHTNKKLELDGFSALLANRNDIRLAIVDEASSYKDAQTKRHRIARLVFGKKDYLWLLTGTPTPNAPTDAYGLAKMINNAQGKSFRAFQEETMHKISQFRWVPRKDGYDKARALLTPSIRYDIKDVWDGPEMTTQQREVALTPDQKKYLGDLKRDLQVVVKSGHQITAINEAASPAYLADTFWILRAKSYVADVDAKPSQEKFLLGWMHRLINGL